MYWRAGIKLRYIVLELPQRWYDRIWLDIYCYSTQFVNGMKIEIIGGKLVKNSVIELKAQSNSVLFLQISKNNIHKEQPNKM